MLIWYMVTYIMDHLTCHGFYLFYLGITVVDWQIVLYSTFCFGLRSKFSCGIVNMKGMIHHGSFYLNVYVDIISNLYSG